MSVTRTRTLQMRRSVVTGELRVGFDWGLLEGKGDPSRAMEASAGSRSSAGAISLMSEKRPVWFSESGPGEGGEGLLPARSFPRRARRLARVGGLSSLSDIPPESSIVTRDFRASGAGGKSPRDDHS